MSGAVQHHIRCAPGDVAPVVLLPGDPARADRIARLFDGARLVARNREYTTHTGTWKGAPVSVTSTGIGGPSTAIAVEELARIGAHTFIRVGTSGSMQAPVGPGDLVVATGAIRDEGTSAAYLPLEFPAVGDPRLAALLFESAAATGRTAHLGVMHSKDAFFGQTEPRSLPMADRLLARWSAWVAGGAMCSEMETATLMVVAAVRGLRAGSICLVASSADRSRRIGGGDLDAAVDDMTRAALDAATRLPAPDPARALPNP